MTTNIDLNKIHRRHQMVWHPHSQGQAIICFSVRLILLLIACSRLDSVSVASTVRVSSHTFPIAFDALLRRTPIIEISINHSKPLRFVVDTGFVGDVGVTPEVAKQLALHPFQAIPGIKTNSVIKDKVFDMVVVPRISLLAKNRHDDFELPQKSLACLVMPKSSFLENFTEDHLDGVLGMHLLDSMALTFDFHAGTMTLYPQGTLPPVSKRAAVVAMSCPQAHCYCVTLSSGTQTFPNCCIDTGAETSCIPQEIAQKLKLLSLGEVSYVMVADEGEVGGYLLPHLQLGTEIVSDLEVMGRNDQWLVGMNLLARYRVTLDFPRRRLALERASDYTQQARLIGFPTIEVSQESKGFVIKDASQEVNLAGKDVQNGDRLLAVDGKSLVGLSLEGVLHLLAGYAGTKSTLILERDAKTFSVSYSRKDILDMAETAAIDNASRNGGMLILRYGGVVLPPADINAGMPIQVEPGKPVKVPPGSAIIINPKPH